MEFMVTWDTYFGLSLPGHKHERIKKIARGQGVLIGDTIEISEAVTVPALVNHGRWIIHCPWCNSAEFAREDCLFFCSEGCQNQKVGQKYIRSYFPENREEIEGILLKRPRENRNWEAPDTVEFLRQENAEHGV